MNYSLIGIALAFVIGICFGLLLELNPIVVWAVATGVAIAAILLARVRRVFLGGLLVTIALLGFLRCQTSQLPLEWLYQKANHLREVTGTVVSYPSLGEGYTGFVLVPDHLPGKIRVTWFWKEGEHRQVCYGDRLHLVGSVKAPERLPDFDYRAYLARQGVFATMAIDKDGQVEWIGTGGSSLLRLGDSLRQKLLKRLTQVLPSMEAGLAQGLLFGDRTALLDEVEEAFRHTGLMHLLAVSGLHLGIFLAVLWFILRFVGLRPAITYPLVGITVLLILWLVGPRLSLVRASLLFAFLALGSVLADLGIILRRWTHSYYGLAAAALVVLAIRPTTLFDVGFHLSFGATAAIIAVFNPFFGVQQWINSLAERAPGSAWYIRYPLGLLIVSAAAQAGTAPFIAYHFGTIHPIVLVANLLVIPLATLALWSGVLTLSFSWTPLFHPVGTLLGWLLKSLIWVVEKLGRLPFAELPVPSWIGVWIGGLVLFLFGLALYSRGSLLSTWYSTSITPLSLSLVVPPNR